MPTIADDPDSTLAAATCYRITIHAAATLPRLKQRKLELTKCQMFLLLLFFLKQYMQQCMPSASSYLVLSGPRRGTNIHRT